jgi:hypothetical protein
MTPAERMLGGPDASRPAPPIDVLRRRFTRKETRTQRRGDGTVSIKGIRFEMPSRLRTLRHPTIRWRSWDLSLAWVVDSRTDDVLAEIRPVDKETNARRGRRIVEPIPGCEAPKPSPDDDPLPPLLRKLLAEYSATGLPPAYLPKDELLREKDDEHA